MIALVPQTEQRHRSANGLAILAPQSQLVPGCFAMAFLDTPCSQNMPDHRYPLFHTYMQGLFISDNERTGARTSTPSTGKSSSAWTRTSTGSAWTACRAASADGFATLRWFCFTCHQAFGGLPIARVPLPIPCDVLPANPARAPYGSHNARVSVKRNWNAESAQNRRGVSGNAKEDCNGKQGYSRSAGSTLGCL
jgi:hypothetical protein